MLIAAGLSGLGVAYAEPGMAFSSERAPLVSRGVFQGTIFYAEAAKDEDIATARYLAEWIGRVVGHPVAVLSEDSAASGSSGIFLGATRPAAARRVTPPTTLSRDASVFQPIGSGRYCLVGESSHALRMGVGRLLEEVFGVSFLMPGRFGSEYTRIRRLPAPVHRVEYRPAVTWRQLHGMHTDAEKSWAANVGLGQIPYMNHALWSVFDADAFKEDPRMFPMLSGKMVAPSGRGGYEPQPNLAYSGSVTYAAKMARRYFEKHPGDVTFSLSINDNMTWDESPETLAKIRPTRYFRNRPDYSDYVFGFMNGVASTLDQWGEPKDKYLTGYAYYHCEQVPSFPLNPRVFPVLTADRSEWRDPAFAAEDAALIDAWSRTGAAHFGIYDYYYGLNMAAPRIFYDAEIRSIQYAASRGVSLFFAEVEPDWGFDAPKCWLAAKLLWDPSANGRQLLDTYFKTAYGPAAESMRRFHALVERCWTERNQAPRWIRFFNEESVFELFSDEALRAMRLTLADAEASLRSDRFEDEAASERRLRERMRVRMTVLAFERFYAHATKYRALRELIALSDGTSTREEGAAAREKWETASRELTTRLEAANTSELRIGAPFNPAIYWKNDVDSWLAAKWSARWRELMAEGSPLTMRAAALAEPPPVGVDRVVVEGFEADSFKPASPGSWASLKSVTIPKAPWRTNLFEAERTRFGYSEERVRSGRGSLIVADGDLARISRVLPVFGGDTVALRLRYSGDIVPGVHLGAELLFRDAEGKLLRNSVSVIAPSGKADWALLPLAGTAPMSATTAELTVRVMNQVAGDAVWIDDLEIRRCANGEILE